jgi:hypothetical protein
LIRPSSFATVTKIEIVPDSQKILIQKVATTALIRFDGPVRYSTSVLSGASLASGKIFGFTRAGVAAFASYRSKLAHEK